MRASGALSHLELEFAGAVLAEDVRVGLLRGSRGEVAAAERHALGEAALDARLRAEPELARIRRSVDELVCGTERRYAIPWDGR